MRHASSQRRLPLALAAGVALLLLFLLARGCGDDSLGEDELRRQAAAICLDMMAATDRVAVPNAPSEATRFLGEGAAYMQPALRDLRRLKAPESLRDRYDRAVGLGQRQARLIADAEQQARDGGDVIAIFRRLQRETAPLVRDGNALWRGLEIQACVQR